MRGALSWRKWAKFIVHYFIWQEVKSNVMKHPRTFIRLCEIDDAGAIDSLRAAMESVFDVALRAYAKYSSMGEHKGIEVSPYFKGKDHQAFANFERLWKSNSNGKSQKAYSRNLEMFFKELKRAVS